MLTSHRMFQCRRAVVVWAVVAGSIPACGIIGVPVVRRESPSFRVRVGGCDGEQKREVVTSEP